MDELREKCPWDKKQTIHTLRAQTIEELYELTAAITAEDWHNMKEELGDLLIHILFYARIAEEQGHFGISAVMEAVSEKLISRHPHIYADVKVADDEEVKRNWEQLKLREGKKSVLSGVPASLPAVVKAMRLQEKAKQVGFEWERAEQVWDKVEEELEELQEAVGHENHEQMTDEFGDVLFSLVNYARFIGVDPEHALEKTNQKFIKRFTELERIAGERGKSLSGMSLQDMDAIWEQVKKQKSGT